MSEVAIRRRRLVAAYGLSGTKFDFENKTILKQKEYKKEVIAKLPN